MRIVGAGRPSRAAIAIGSATETGQTATETGSGSVATEDTTGNGIAPARSANAIDTRIVNETETEIVNAIVTGLATLTGPQSVMVRILGVDSLAVVVEAVEALQGVVGDGRDAAATQPRTRLPIGR